MAALGRGPSKQLFPHNAHGAAIGQAQEVEAWLEVAQFHVGPGSGGAAAQHDPALGIQQLEGLRCYIRHFEGEFLPGGIGVKAKPVPAVGRNAGMDHHIRRRNRGGAFRPGGTGPKPFVIGWAADALLRGEEPRAGGAKGRYRHVRRTRGPLRPGGCGG